MGDSFEEIAVVAAKAFFTTVTNATAAGSLRYEDMLREIESERSLLANTLKNPIDYKIGRLPDWTRSPALFFFTEGAAPPPEGGGIQEQIREVELFIGVAYNGPTDVEADELTILRYQAAIRATVELNFQLATVQPQYVAACVEVEADQVLDLTDKSATRKARYIKFICTVQDQS